MSKVTEKQEALDQIAACIEENNVCPDLAREATNLVPGSGNPDADIVFIGEAPGKNEDLKGKPFVGAAGKFLEEMLADINLTRDDVFITNVIKYRPPNNRDPRSEEIKESMPYLLDQITVIEPMLIATLGRFALNIFMPDLKISRVHGEPKRIKLILPSKVEGAQESNEQRFEQIARTQVILPLYHPAAALYNGSMRSVLKNDFRKIPKTLELIQNKKEQATLNN